MNTILIVDDLADIREILENVLITRGFEVISCENGKQAVDYIQGCLLNKKKMPLAVFTDNTMPELDGIGLIRHLRNMESSKVREIPVILMSGYPVDVEGYELGINDFLLKPFRAETVFKILDTFLQ